MFTRTVLRSNLRVASRRLQSSGPAAKTPAPPPPGAKVTSQPTKPPAPAAPAKPPAPAADKPPTPAAPVKPASPPPTTPPPANPAPAKPAAPAPATPAPAKPAPAKPATPAPAKPASPAPAAPAAPAPAKPSTPAPAPASEATTSSKAPNAAPALAAAAVKPATTGVSSLAKKSFPQRFGAGLKRDQFSRSHLLSGLVGGTLVLAFGYTCYQFSDLKKTVEASRQIQSYLRHTRDQVLEKGKKVSENPIDILKYLQNVAQSYTTFIPGADNYVESTFKQIREIQREHSSDADKILKNAKNEIVSTVQKGKPDGETAAKVFELLRRTIRELNNVALRSRESVLDQYPAIKEKIHDTYDQISKIAETGSAEVRKLWDEANKQIKEMIAKGSLTPEKPDEAKKLLQNTLAQVQQLQAKEPKKDAQMDGKTVTVQAEEKPAAEKEAPKEATKEPAKGGKKPAPKGKAPPKDAPKGKA